MQEAIFSCLSLSKKVHASSSSGYHDIQVLESISFTLLEGNFYCLLGASGSGKTSLLQIIALLDQSFSGSCKLFGTDVSSMSDNQMTLVRRCDIGFVYQFHHLMYDFNVFENVAFPLKLGGHNNSEIEHRVYDVLSEIGMRNMAMTKIGALSGGERQRVAIARAVVHQPRLLILDEPTGNLDAKTGEKVIELLLYMKAKFKSTIIMATHNVRHAEIANRIMHIENGELLH